MYQIHYLVPTAGGSASEHVVKINEYAELKAVLNQCKKLGYKIGRNPMCDRCILLGADCEGEINHVYNGCVYREVA